MRIRGPLFVVLLLGVLLQCAAARATQIWYEDNNLGHGGGMPPDFVEKFHKPDTFAQATKFINVYMLRANVLQKMDDKFLTDLLLPYLKKNNIKLAINAGGATWLRANARRRELFEAEIGLLRRIKRLGGNVSYISLQSVLSKPMRRKDAPQLAMDQRVAGVVEYAQAARTVFPDVQIGIIDALLSQGREYKAPYRQLVDALDRQHLKLAYVHLDVSFKAPQTRQKGVTWQAIHELERYVETDLGAQFGLFAQSRKAGQTSSAAFHHDVLAALDCYAGSGGTPREYIVASWFPYPDRTIPETATGNDFPARRIVLDFGRKLDKIEHGGAAWQQQRQADGGWRQECGIK
jgi:hypothetical protein